MSTSTADDANIYINLLSVPDEPSRLCLAPTHTAVKKTRRQEFSPCNTTKCNHLAMQNLGHQNYFLFGHFRNQEHDPDRN